MGPTRCVTCSFADKEYADRRSEQRDDLISLLLITGKRQKGDLTEMLNCSRDKAGSQAEGDSKISGQGKQKYK